MIKKNISFILVVISFILLLLDIFIGAFKDGAIPVTSSLAIFGSLPLVLSLGFLLSKSKSLQTVAYALLAVLSVSLLAVTLSVDFDNPAVELDVMSLLTGLAMLGAVLVHFISKLLAFFGFYRDGLLTIPSTNYKVLTLKKWNKLTMEGKISEDNYNVVKDKVLAEDFNSTENNDLEQLRQLLEAGLITAQDLASKL